MPSQSEIHRSGQAALRAVAALALVALATSLAAPAAAQSQTAARTLKIVYAYAAGNSGDALCRLAADRLGSRLGMSAIVENRAGASARIGTRAVIAAEPDGTTLLCSPMAPIALHPVTYSNLDYDPFTALTPLSQLATFDIALAAGPGAQGDTLPALVAWLKVNPDKAAYANPGLGGLPHFFAVMFAGSAGLTLRNVPYRGSGAVLNDIVSGQLPMAVVPTADMLELHKSGRVRILATSASARSPLLPNVPTFKEAGYDIAGEGWYGIYAPAKMPPAKTAELITALQETMRDPDLRARIAALGFVPTGTSGETLAKLQVQDRALWLPAIQASGFKPTD